MGESLVQVTEGTGKKLHTWQRTIGANNVEDEIVQLGEQYLPEYRNPGSTSYVSTATGDSHLLQIMAGASLNVYVRRIRVYQVGAATTGANHMAQVVRLTTAGTGGTSQGFAPLDTTAAAAGASGMTLPTVKGAEGTIVDGAVAYYNQTVGAVNPSSPTLLYDFDYYRNGRGQSLRIPAGAANGIAVKNRSAVAGATVYVVAEISEASF